MKVALINPPYSSYLYGSEESIKSVSPPINLLYLHAYINNYCDVKLFDGECFSRLEELIHAVSIFNPDIIGYTATSPTFPIVKKISKIFQGKKLQIIGGAYSTVAPQDVLGFLDIAVISEGEETLLEIINGKPLKGINGIAFIDNGELVFTAPRHYRKNIDSFPFPSWHLIDFDLYKSSIHRNYGSRSAPILTSRGCYYDCHYCSTKLVNGKKVRYRSIQNVEDEIEMLKNDYNIEHINIWDDTFTLNKKRLKLLSSVLKKSLLTYSCNTRPDVFGDEEAYLLAESGCTNVFFGVESGNRAILSYYGRSIPLEKIRKAFKSCNKYHLNSTASFIIGSPLETKETLYETLEFAKKLKPDFVLFNILTPHKGTKIYLDAILSGEIHDYEVNLEKYPIEPIGIPTIENPLISRDSIQLWKAFMYRKFYFRFKYICQQIYRALRSKDYKRIKTTFKLIKTYK